MQMDRTAGAPMMQAHINHQLAVAEEERDKYETSNGFAMKTNNSNTIRVKQFIPPQPRERKNAPSSNVEMARYEESAGDMASVKDRITVYDQNDRFGLRDLAQTNSFMDEKSYVSIQPPVINQKLPFTKPLQVVEQQ